MLRKCQQFVLLAAVLLLSAGSGRADEVWVAVDPPRPAPDEVVTVRLMEGDPVKGTERLLDVDRLVRFQRLWKNGRRNLAHGAAPTVRFETAGAGVELLSLTTARVAGPGGAEPVTHFSKTFVVVGDNATAGTLRYSEVGQRLEIVLQSDPVRLAGKGGTVEVQVLYDREPLADAVVYAVPVASPSTGSKRAVTDEIGLVRFPLDHAGSWMLKVSLVTPCADCRVAKTETLRSTMVLSSGG